MLRNHFKIAWRNLWKNRAFSILNVLGLAVSMSVCLLIIMIIADQYSFDTYHTNKEHIYRVHTNRYNTTGRETASSALPLAKKLREEYAIVDQAAGLNKQIGGDLIYNENFASGGGYFAEQNIFKILDFSFNEGNPDTALEDPYSLVITSELKQFLFPNEPALGKVVEFHDKGILAAGVEEGNFEKNYGSFTITGVLHPNPGKTHLPFKFLASQSTMSALRSDNLFFFEDNNWADVWTNYTYVLLKKGQDQKSLQLALDQIAREQYPAGEKDRFSFKAIPLKAITPGGIVGNTTHVSLPKVFLFILMVLCLIVMLSACLNYTNLSVAQAFKRFKEVGVRKVAGATRTQVFLQFIIEAVVISLLSLVFAYILLLFLQNIFSDLWLNRFLAISFRQNLAVAFAFIGFSLMVGLISGILPAIYISAINPMSLFQKFRGLRIFKGVGIHKAFIVIQFTVSLVFIISVLLLNSQARHLLNFDYGFDTEDIITVKLYNPDNYNKFAQETASLAEISHIGATSLLPAGGVNMGASAIRLTSLQDTIPINYMDINHTAIATFGLKIIAGENFTEHSNENHVLLNELAVESFNFITNEDAIGKQIFIENQTVEVVGIVQDFNFLSSDRPLENLMIRNRSNQFAFAAIKIRSEDRAKTVAAIEQIWIRTNPRTKFVHSYLDDELRFIHIILTDVFYIIGLLSFLAIFVSCLGLLGMSAYNSQLRKKEIGIRKVLGSTMFQIVLLLSKGFMLLLCVAICIAVPLAYLINMQWLESFASHINISFSHIALGVALILVLSFFMIFSQSYTIGKTNPIKTLRTE